MKNYSISQTKGQNLRQVVSRLLVKSPITVIKEFVSNSWDADAENVGVQIEESDKQITIEDDGTGMSETGLQNFLSMGDSEKLQNPISEKGRIKIGKFGIANTLLQFLGEGYQLQTWKDDSYIEGFEDFQPNPTGGIRYDVHTNPTKKHGTSIVIERSRFVGSQLLNLNRLEDSLAWELPEPRPDFRVTLNGYEVKRIIPDPIEIIEFQDELNYVGKVDMKISLYDKPVRINGLYVYVNQRSVGNSNIFQLKRGLRISPSKVLITVNADGLRDSIVFNREKMIEDEKFLEVRKYIYKRLSGIRRSERPSRAKVVVPSRDLISNALKQTTYLDTIPDAIVVPVERIQRQEYHLDSSGNGNGNFKPHQRQYQEQIKSSISPELSINNHKQKKEKPSNVLGFRTVNRGQNDSPATYNSSTRQLAYNQNHPLISSIDIINQELFNMHILLATSLGVAEESYLKQGGSTEYTTKFNALLAKVLSTDSLIDSIMQSRNSNEIGRFAPSRDYNLQDVIAQGIATPVASRALVRAGILNLRSEKISGKDINDYISKSSNHTPAIDLVWYEWGKSQVASKKLTRARIGQIAQKIDSKLTHFASHLPFIYNVGVTNPFFLVENEYTPEFLGLLAQGAFKGHKGLGSYEETVERNLPLIKKIVGESKETRFVSLDDLCGVTRGSPHEVMKIVGYSQRHGLNLPIKKEGDQILYSIHHFKKARLNYLEVKNE
ncbi:MAG: ATP-binding protein [Candidatus Pacearchaeota archaeon]|jgi:hypothetical protein